MSASDYSHGGIDLVQHHAEDRLVLTLFVALALHAVLVFGVSFELPKFKAQFSKTLEVTLAQFESEEKPEQADFIAQNNQQGSGNLDKIIDPASLPPQVRSTPRPQELAVQVTPTPEPDPSAVIQPDNTQDQPQATAIQQEVVTTQSPSTQQINRPEQASTRAQAQRPSETELDLENLTMAELEAQIDEWARNYAKRPRKRFISASTHTAPEALYLKSWRRKIETIGNANYPSESRRRNVYGSLRLEVSINADGSLYGIQLVDSSGHKFLDDAAMRIVELAAPFAPLPPAVTRDHDVLVIIRTWRFSPNLRFAGQ